MLEKFTQELITFIDKSPSMFHTVQTLEETLIENAFKYLEPSMPWKLQKGGKYYTTCNGSSLIAFRVDSLTIEEEGFKIIGAHGDVPGFRIKPEPQITTEGYIKLNTESYGGPILNTWLDRPLSIAGRVSLKGEHPLHPVTRLVDLNKPLLIIPNLAIHMNREVNNGVTLNKQKDTLPLLTYTNEPVEENLILELVSKTLDIPKETILDMELFLYPFEKGMKVGLNEEFISSSRLDDLSMVYSGLQALLTSQSQTGISLFACFDNEEIGSRTKQGADSPLLIQTLERILLALGKSREELFMALSKSFMISADVAHLTHPNSPEKCDPTHRVLPGKGPAIKVNANFSYTTDSDSASSFMALCKDHAIPYQIFVNRSDEKGGSTIGPVATSHLGIRSVDIGTPMLAMHSARELMASMDVLHTYHALLAFYNLN
ncbi:M18 family aminopeptidase [Sporanaerobium hydrogeniformans]|uniref:M18 family aminopeptidase n=1 Tax=Sporanaerobium hydrogeniformans TaxID=3072179 RepID=A0AC61DA30_9FIRM|nr:M18 family aminopeptidase [Sporanaerobium hydrogeniformans]PHV69882.1 M18 family aminopeptidase [Sporanaerobium hydrogeniformans]